MRTQLEPGYLQRGCRLVSLPLAIAACLATAGSESELTIHPVAGNEVELNWQGLGGHTYVLGATTDLDTYSWRTTEPPITGSDLPESRLFPANLPRRFFRLSHTAGDLFAVSDFDGDGVPTAWEIANRYDPLDPRSALQDDDRDGRTTLTEYLSQSDPDTADAPGVSYVYDDKGQLIKVVYPEGRSMSHTYDATGNMLGATTNP